MDAAASDRIEQIRKQLETVRAQALVVTHLPNVLYLCGFTGSNAILIVLPDSIHLFTDSRYTLQARQEAPGVRIHITRGALADAVRRVPAQRAARAHGSRCAVAFEAANLSVAQWTRLRSAAGKRVRWKSTAEPGRRHCARRKRQASWR